MKKIIGKLLIVLGILIISTVLIMNYNTSKINKKMVEEYKNNINNSEVRQDEYKNGDVVGVLNIPKIDLLVIIKRGVDEEALKYGVGHFENTPMPGESGNFSVAGHSAYTTNKFFSNLDKLDIGDEIYVLSNNINHKYIVNSIEVVKPEEVGVVESTDTSKKEITLVTCTPKYVGSHRLIVKGIYVE